MLARAWAHCSRVATVQLFICSVLRRWETSDFQVKGLHSNGGVCMLKNTVCQYRIPNDCCIQSSLRTHARLEISTRTANLIAFGEQRSLHNVETQ